MTNKNTPDHTLKLLRKLHNAVTTMHNEMNRRFDSADLQLASLNERDSAQLIAEIDIREQLRQQNARIERIERRMELTDE